HFSFFFALLKFVYISDIISLSLHDALPISIVVSIMLIGTFFITSADSATFVMGMQTTNGMLNPPLPIKAIWGLVQSAAAIVLLWSGGLNGLQSAAIVSAFPFTIILIFIMISLHRGLREEKATIKKIFK